MLQAIILIKLIKSIDCVILIKLIYRIDGASKLICFISSRYLVGVLLIGALLIEHPKLINLISKLINHSEAIPEVLFAINLLVLGLLLRNQS